MAILTCLCGPLHSAHPTLSPFSFLVFLFFSFRNCFGSDNCFGHADMCMDRGLHTAAMLPDMHSQHQDQREPGHSEQPPVWGRLLANVPRACFLGEYHTAWCWAREHKSPFNGGTICKVPACACFLRLCSVSDRTTGQTEPQGVWWVAGLPEEPFPLPKWNCSDGNTVCDGFTNDGRGTDMV